MNAAERVLEAAKSGQSVCFPCHGSSSLGEALLAVGRRFPGSEVFVRLEGNAGEWSQLSWYSLDRAGVDRVLSRVASCSEKYRVAVFSFRGVGDVGEQLSLFAVAGVVLVGLLGDKREGIDAP